MEEKKQASVKQVQFLEILEKRTGDKFTGERWVMSDVSDYISNHSKNKGKNDSSNVSTFKATNQYQEGSSNSNHVNKITDKQRQYIKVLENKTGAFFNGKTFEDAEKYIKEHRAVS